MTECRSAKRHRRGILLKIALALTLALFPSSASGAPAEEEAVSTSEQHVSAVHESRDDYLEGRVDRNRAQVSQPNILQRAIAWFTGADLSSFRESGHTLYLKTTLLDAGAAGTDITFDAVYARADWMNLIAGQYDSTLDLLDPGADSPCFVAMAAAPTLNGLGRPTDFTFAELSNDGTLVEGAYLDCEQGIAYVPKSLYQEGGADAPYACQLQLLVPMTFETIQDPRADISIRCNDARVEAVPFQTITSDPFDVTVRIPVATPKTAGYLNLSDLHVKLNGSTAETPLVEGENANWDTSTGELELAISPQTLLEVDITTDAPTLLDLIAEPAMATASSDLAYVPDIVFDSLNLDTLTPGRVIPFDSYINYWWAHPDPNDFQWHACVNSGAYCYSWINDPDALYEYLAWSDGADWSGVSSRDVSNFWVDPNASQAARNYFNYVFEFYGWTLEDQSFHSEKWPINNPYNTGEGWASFGLQCSHVRNPVGTGPVQEDGNGRMAIRVLDVNQSAERPYVVLGFVGPSVANQPGVGIYKFEIQASGDIALAKGSSQPTLTQNNQSYRLEGVAYDIFADAGCTTYVCSITLDRQGRGTSKRLKEGTYWIRENAASLEGSGFAWDKTARTVEVQKGKTTEMDLVDVPQSYEPQLILRKVDSITANSTPQGDGTLQHAEFEIKHFGSISTDLGGLSGATPLRSWVFTTDETGCILMDEEHKTGGDDLYLDTVGNVCIPLGTLTIQETTAPEGYLPDTQIRLITLPSSGINPSILLTQCTTVSEDVLRGGVLIEKRDAESLLQSPLGAASLDGAVFDITNVSAHAVCVDGVMHEPGEVVMSIVSEGGSAQTASDALPFGTYTIQEKSAGTGYLASDDRKRTFSIREAGTLVPFVRGQAAANQVKRGDLDFRKVLATDQSRLSRVPFILESETTGERHILTSDENGIVDTSSTRRAHTASTNANDRFLDATQGGEGGNPINADELDMGAGCWFGATQEGGITQPDDSLGALPYDTYRLTELRSTSNAGYDLIRISGIHITSHGLSVPLGDIEDRITPPPAITTCATSATDASKHIFPDPAVSITDRVDYCNLNPGQEYHLTGSLRDAESGEPIDDGHGMPLCAHLTFTPAASSGSCKVLFELDASDLAGKRIVCFETLREGIDGEIVAEHEELTDAGQSIQVIAPKINTYATDSDSAAKEMLSTDNAVIEDAVSYSGLEEGAEYLLRGILMRKMAEDGKMAAQPMLDESGQQITCSTTFTPLTSTGFATVSFPLDATQLAEGDELVVYETLYKDGRAIVVHENPENDAQTITIRSPRIETHAFEKRSGEKTCAPDETLAITDEVLYESLEIGKTYTVFGTIMLAAQDEGQVSSASPLLNPSGNKVTASATFVPSLPSGSVFVDFEVNTEGLEGMKLVAFERLTCEGRIVAVHEDPTSESQTIEVRSKEPSPNPKGTNASHSLPQTGDATPVALFTLMAILAGASLIIARRSWSHSNDKKTRVPLTEGPSPQRMQEATGLGPRVLIHLNQLLKRFNRS